MRAVALALFLVCSAGASTAQTITGVDVLEYGIYTAERVREVPTADGLHYTLISNICHVATTSVVPMKRRVRFGFRFRTNGNPPGAMVELTRATLYPHPTTPRGATSPVTRTQYSSQRRLGAVSYIGYSISGGSANHLGRWTFQLLQGERVLAAKSFDVIPDDGRELPDGNDANCFVMS